MLVLTPDLPCTFDFRCNARALAALVGLVRAGGAFGAPVERVMLVGFSAGGLSSLLGRRTRLAWWPWPHPGGQRCRHCGATS